MPHEQPLIIEKLISLDQKHLLSDWDAEGIHDDQKREMLEQLGQVDQQYTGGLKGYLDNARQLLRDVNEGKNPYDGYAITPPDYVDLSALDGGYREMENLGFSHVSSVAFVLVAGGLGERLGYDGIKIAIPVESVTGRTYLQLYCEMIKAIEDKHFRKTGTKITVPFFIMTSDGIHDRLVDVLETHDYFGLSPEQFTLMEQMLVPALDDPEPHIAKESAYRINLKPNGHGYIHRMLYASGYASELHEKGKTHLVFLQDTNAQIVNLLLPALGVSLVNELDFNYVAVPRIAKEAIGALVHLKKDGRASLVNVEYNVLDALLKANGFMQGDVAGESGYSVYPGNINLLVIKLSSYIDSLERTKGAVPEFINPKYSDDSKSVFSKPTRVESLMQDFPKLYIGDEKTGVTLFQRDWAFAPNKNNLANARKNLMQGVPPDCATTAESGYYSSGRMKLKSLGMEMAEGQAVEFHGIPFSQGAKVVLGSSFSLTLEGASRKIQGGCLSEKSILVLDGEEIFLENVTLKGNSALIIQACQGARVQVKGLTLANNGYRMIALNDADLNNPDIPSWQRMRGYRVEFLEPARYCFDQPGEYIIERNGNCIKLKG